MAHGKTFFKMQLKHCHSSHYGSSFGKWKCGAYDQIHYLKSDGHWLQLAICPTFFGQLVAFCFHISCIKHECDHKNEIKQYIACVPICKDWSIQMNYT